MLVLLACIAAAEESEFRLKQTIWPTSPEEMGLFARTVDIAQDMLVVGAEDYAKGNDKIGAVYAYQYNPKTDLFEAVHGTSTEHYRIEPEDANGVIPGRFGARVMISSSDVKRMVVGAPYSNVITSYEGLTIAQEEGTAQDADLVTKDNQQYYKELGAVYVYELVEKAGVKLWEKKYVSVPKTVVFQGGYGRAIAATSDLNSFAGSYYNKIKKGLPEKIGKVFVETWKEDHYEQSAVIDPPTEINQKDKQRFGADVDFYQSNEIFVTVQGEGAPGGVYRYQSNGNNWNPLDPIQPQSAANYQSFGIISGIRDNSLIAIYGENANGPNDVLILTRSGDTWTEHQKISLGTKEVSDHSGITFCGEYLAIVMANGDAVSIYRQNGTDHKYYPFQDLQDPKIVKQGVDVPYDQQYVVYASDIAWDKETCSKLAVASMSKSGSGKTAQAEPYGKVYLYSLEKKPDPEDSDLGLILGCVAAGIAVIVLVIVIVWLLRRKKYAAQEDDVADA